RYAEEFGPSHRLAVRITGDSEERFPEQVETTLYRIVQEALANVARHAQARNVEVIIRRDNGSVRATVRDDGRGFDVTAASGPAYGRSLLAAGALGYVTKKAADRELLLAIRTVREGRHFVDLSQAEAMLPNPGPLSQREQQVLTELAQGFTHQEIADRLALSI